MPHERTADWREDRDAWELALLDAAREAQLPVLGICRGMQVMAVHAGGHLDQHVPDTLGHENHSPGGDVYGDVKISLVEGTQLEKVLVTGPTVRCHHHQSVLDHPELIAAAHSDDGMLEASRGPGPPVLAGGAVAPRDPAGRRPVHRPRRRRGDASLICEVAPGT